MKKYVIRAISLLLCAVSVISLGSCTHSPEEPTEEVFVLTAENLAAYTIVVPEKIGKQIASAASTLQKNIKSVTDTELEIKSDAVIEGSALFCESEYEIIIGNADREGVAEYYENIRSDDC